jgi:hypothetical protein
MAGSPQFIVFSTSYPELDRAATMLGLRQEGLKLNDAIRRASSIIFCARSLIKSQSQPITWPPQRGHC